MFSSWVCPAGSRNMSLNAISPPMSEGEVFSTIRTKPRTARGASSFSWRCSRLRCQPEPPKFGPQRLNP